MASEINGKVSQILPMESGEGKNGIWKKQYFVIEYMDGQYPKKVCIQLWGDKTDILKSLQPGTDVKVAFNVESREYNGKWYTDVKAWRVEVGGSSTSASAPAAAFAEPNFDSGPAGSGGHDSDLPF
jgi:hypothetical protein